MQKSVEKVMAYITRDRAEGTEILVFEHRDFPAAGIQVPAGTVEMGENIASAALREVREESGLQFDCAGDYLGRFEWFREDRNELHFRNIFHFKRGNDVPDEWLHAVDSSGEDGGLVFRYYWLPVEKGVAALANEQGKYLSLLNPVIPPHTKTE